jgi:hypothetical protein
MARERERGGERWRGEDSTHDAPPRARARGWEKKKKKPRKKHTHNLGETRFDWGSHHSLAHREGGGGVCGEGVGRTQGGAHTTHDWLGWTHTRSAQSHTSRPGVCSARARGRGDPLLGWGRGVDDGGKDAVPQKLLSPHDKSAARTLHTHLAQPKCSASSSRPPRASRPSAPPPARARRRLRRRPPSARRCTTCSSAATSPTPPTSSAAPSCWRPSMATCSRARGRR